MSTYCQGVKVAGKIRKDNENSLGQRHLGLDTILDENRSGIESLERLADPVDLDVLMDIAETAEGDLPDQSPYVKRDVGAKIAVPYDDAYCFYYRENLECLEASGLQVKRFSPVNGDMLPDADAVYLGGGYPELHADDLAENRDFLEGVKNMSDEGRPVLGECGGLMSMCSGMVDKEGKRHRMIGIFGCDSVFVNKRHGPTYVIADANDSNPLFKGQVRAHEYHYSEVEASKDDDYGFSLRRGAGITDSKDGLVRRNTIGTYMHQHALSTDDWAKGFCDKL
jgi:cobyrinic acid a,c-diamide synthase